MVYFNFLEWAKQHKAEDRTIRGFWNNFHSYREEEPEEFVQVFGEFREELLELEMYQISLAFDWLDHNKEPEVVTRMRIVYNGIAVGEYRLVFDLAGQVIDDYFVTY